MTGAIILYYFNTNTLKKVWRYSHKSAMRKTANARSQATAVL